MLGEWQRRRSRGDVAKHKVEKAEIIQYVVVGLE
jgi:hypothetical protein